MEISKLATKAVAFFHVNFYLFIFIYLFIVDLTE